MASTLWAAFRVCVCVCLAYAHTLMCNASVVYVQDPAVYGILISLKKQHYMHQLAGYVCASSAFHQQVDVLSDCMIIKSQTSGKRANDRNHLLRAIGLAYWVEHKGTLTFWWNHSTYAALVSNVNDWDRLDFGFTSILMLTLELDN